MSAEEQSKLNLPETEDRIIAAWDAQKIFEKTLAKNKKGKPFVFYEGPPTANGKPGIHHALTRVFKDVILRYKTMRGFYVPRKAGWDTHGLPVEIKVEKELGFQTKHDIEKYGIGRFNEKAKESVWQYKNEWEKFTKRIGFWIDLEHPYITYDTAYMETLWGIIKEAWKKGLLYQDFKSLPWCPRCGTGLSSHEVGQGYKKVKEDSVFVKLRIVGATNEFLLVWTTTPWTLPANVAVAINPKLEYTKYRVGDEFVWSAVVPPVSDGVEASVVEKVSGTRLVDMKYEPLFDVPEAYSVGAKPPYKVFPADFVSVDEGTGMVHIAPAFGEDDLNLMKAAYKKEADASSHAKGLYYPILQTVNLDGTMKKRLVGEGKFVKEADRDVIEYLKRRSLLLRVQAYEHEYPFCWRCSSPLLYFAKTSWWIGMSRLKKELLENNNKVNWIPEHIKHGRFGEFLGEVRDWAFSRERYWGTTLPVWQCEKCGVTDVVGSREELAKKKGNPQNTYFYMRHGESLANVQNISSYAIDGKYRLTLRGRTQAEKAAEGLKKERIDLIFTSDVLRTRETAEIVARALGVRDVRIESRLREIHTGMFEGRPNSEYHGFFSSLREKFIKRPIGKGAEDLRDVRKRIVSVVEDLEKKYKGRRILLVSHEFPLWMLCAGSLGLTDDEAVAMYEEHAKEFIAFAEVRALEYRELPRDEGKQTNLHRPYADAFSWPCAGCKGAMKRVPEVVDVWFDSGSMPFAQGKFQNIEVSKSAKISEKLAFPADYICEAVDQTRGWFYTLLAVATLLGKGAPYKNVISLGHVLDKNGQKMSKSKGNVVDPETMIQRYGADTLRWYFYTMNAAGDVKRFDENDLGGKLRGFLMTLWNSFVLFNTYVKKVGAVDGKRSTAGLHVLDQWISIRLREMVRDVTKRLDAYDIIGASRILEEFVVSDFSQWFLRRSRRRFQHPASKKELQDVAGTAAHVLLTITKLMAPFIPFLSEAVYLELKKKMPLKIESVHLLDWPDASGVLSAKEKRMIQDMRSARDLVTEALRTRSQAGIKVRQPLASLEIPKQYKKLAPAMLGIVKDEVNVKRISFGNVLAFDTVITAPLKEEGFIREMVRNIQELRRDMHLKQGDQIRLQCVGEEIFMDMIKKWKTYLKSEAGVSLVVIGGKKVYKAERELMYDQKPLWIGITPSSKK